MATKKQRRPGDHTSPILQAIPAACADEAKAVELIEKLRWGKEPCCPRCGDLDVTQMKDAEGNRNARFLWRCQGCKKQFTVRIGSIFEDSRIPLRIWVHAFWRSCSSKKGVSALQISRETGVSYKSALFLMHRIRHAMGVDPETPPQLKGTVEIDETYVGGKPRYHRRGKPGRPKGWSKPMVFAMVERGGEVRAMHVTEVTAANLRSEIDRWVAPGTRVMTDESPLYKPLHKTRPHETVNHRSGEYVRGDVTTNTIEGFFSLLKRGVYGSYHAVSKKHLSKYVAEFAFRFNTRAMDDGERTLEAIRSAEGKRLLRDA